MWYNPDPMSTIIEEDVNFVKLSYEIPDGDIALEKISPWWLCIELNIEMMVDKRLSMAEIVENFNVKFDNDLKCIFNDDNEEKLIPCTHIMNEEGPKWESQDQNFEYDVLLKKN